MKFFYHSILLFIYFSPLFINPHARSTLLNASLVSQETCKEVLDSTRRSLEQVTTSIYQILDTLQVPQGTPDFCKASGAPILIGSTGPDDVKIPKTPNVTVSQDGKGNFKLIMDAIKAAPSHSNNHYVILVKKGVYKEYVNIDQTKTNIVLMGEGKEATIISGSKSVGGGQQTFDSATFAVSAQGFVAIDIGFENTAGQKNMQAVAVLSAGDHAAFHRCKITGNQDTLLVHAGRQFFRECEIICTVDFIFGYGTAVFQKCNIYIRKNKIGGTSVISAHGRNSSTEASGFSFHDCAINGDPQPPTNSSTHAGAYLGRNWGTFARTVFMHSTISNVVRPEGWLQWQSDPVDKLYFGEFQNSGPGAADGGRVKWPGFHQMTAADADKFTVAKFIDGNSWLPALGIPFSPGVKPSADPPKWGLEYSSS
ncbi:PREDICTED: pectinesterase-like [Fragaria vesca subsp. vesca]|uniref:pectinesterase-like n=1 Tax=Fragaria vesca subsp. vesca TaxID=101020 RepID=UPI0002C33E9D|nr:PREDICTED: pectinesterase-like [Fragaria vesca subsp. vesca]